MNLGFLAKSAKSQLASFGVEITDPIILNVNGSIHVYFARTVKNDHVVTINIDSSKFEKNYMPFTIEINNFFSVQNKSLKTNIPLNFDTDILTSYINENIKVLDGFVVCYHSKINNSNAYASLAEMIAASLYIHSHLDANLNEMIFDVEVIVSPPDKVYYINEIYLSADVVYPYFRSLNISFDGFDGVKFGNTEGSLLDIVDIFFETHHLTKGNKGIDFRSFFDLTSMVLY